VESFEGDSTFITLTKYQTKIKVTDCVTNALAYYTTEKKFCQSRLNLLLGSPLALSCLARARRLTRSNALLSLKVVDNVFDVLFEFFTSFLYYFNRSTKTAIQFLCHFNVYLPLKQDTFRQGGLNSKFLAGGRMTSHWKISLIQFYLILKWYVMIEQTIYQLAASHWKFDL
jgi:hypothetical protein